MPDTKIEAELRLQVDSLQQRIAELKESLAEHVRDAEERHRIDKALRESEGQYRDERDRFQKFFDVAEVIQ